MIKEINCDLLEAPVEAIFHCCNCFNVMGAGIALAIKNKYPEAFEADAKCYFVNKKNKLGYFSVAETKDNKFIYNLYTQHRYGRENRQLDYEALYTSLEKACWDLHTQKLKSIVGIPYKMGCYLAGGDWNIVKSILNHFFNTEEGIFFSCVTKNKKDFYFKNELYICKLNK